MLHRPALQITNLPAIGEDAELVLVAGRTGVRGTPILSLLLYPAVAPNTGMQCLTHEVNQRRVESNTRCWIYNEIGKLSQT
jgi:hypothetical protein